LFTPTARLSIRRRNRRCCNCGTHFAAARAGGCAGRLCQRTGDTEPRRVSVFMAARSCKVIDVMPRLLQQNAACPPYWRLAVHAADLRGVPDDLERRAQLLEEEIGCGRPMSAPPFVGFGCGADRPCHRRRRSSSRISEAGRIRPASADCEDEESATCKARRSLSVRSSPSSSATSSMTVPSASLTTPPASSSHPRTGPG